MKILLNGEKAAEISAVLDSIGIGYDKSDDIISSSAPDSGIYDVICTDNINSISETADKFPFVPIIAVTDDKNKENRLALLEKGADAVIDYPIDTHEIKAVINAMLRRLYRLNGDRAFLDDTSLNYQKRTLECGNNSVSLVNKEFEIISFFFKAGLRIISKSDILLRVWGLDSPVDDNNIEVYVSSLRKKLKKIGSTLTIRSIRSIGYQIERI